MDFLKKHYEKIILSLVLLGGAAAAALMPMQLSEERGRLEEQRQQWFGDRVNKFQPTDLSTNALVVKRAQTNNDVQLALQHNVFNPVRWLRRPDGGVMKVSTGDEIGAQAVTVSNIQPLRFVIAYERAIGDPVRYEISVLNELEKPAPDKRLLAKGQTSRFGRENEIQVRDVQGPDPANPVALQVLLNKERDPITISAQKPYERIVGFAADLVYEPTKTPRKGVRKGDKLTFGDETYNIVAINEREVVLSASSNQKQTVRRFDPNARAGADTNAASSNK
ncbi:MAG TPA: hypothetical protein VEH27_08390 [Methylomirabilota bacterium]|nr:hypothetical protein [Methylomirabilota bacterium]